VNLERGWEKDSRREKGGGKERSKWGSDGKEERGFLGGGKGRKGTRMAVENERGRNLRRQWEGEKGEEKVGK
jgi:hypothetical protein